MTHRPLGPLVKDWKPAADPAGLNLRGAHASLTPMDPARDAPGLFAAFDGHDHVWDYLYEPPVKTQDQMEALLHQIASQLERPAYTLRAAGSDAPLGYMTFFTVVRAHGCIEIGNVNLSPLVQRTPIATDAFYLMIDWAFAHGYRRVEWKCNSLNAPSRRAAQRLGFSYEGVFRQHLIVKGRNRDTAWFAMTDTDWQSIRPAFVRWLSPDNFALSGQQQVALADLTRHHLFQEDPTTT